MPKLVGREEDLKEINEAFKRAVKGRGSIVLIGGEIGVGKTRLLTEAEKLAKVNELRILWARCIGGATPLMPFLNALENVEAGPTASEASIEEVFYLHSDGRLIIHETQRQRPDLGDDELKGLLEEIKKTKKARLQGLFLGDRRIIIESGAITVLAAVVRGEETPKMRQQMKYLIATLEDRFGEKFLEWKKGIGQFKGLRDSLKALLLGDYGKPEVLSLDLEISSPSVFEDVARFLITSSRQKPMAILLDDIHWMDGVSLELMETLGKTIEESRVVIVGTYRPEEMSKERTKAGGAPSLSKTLSLLKPMRGAVDLMLKRLTKEQVGEMLGSILVEGDPGTEFVDFVFRHGEGNPFYTEEIIRSVEESGKLFLTDTGWRTGDLTALDIPVTIREAVLVRMASLDKRTKEVLQHAAVIGREWDTMVLSRVLKDPSALEEVLEELETLNLITSVGGANYRFDHDVVRETAYEDMSEAMRKLYHRKVGEAYEEVSGITKAQDEVDEDDLLTEDMLFRLASHFSRSKERKKALRYNLLAGKAARKSHDTRGANNFLTKALKAARGLKKREDIKRILLDLSELCELTGEWDNALSFYDELLLMFQKGEETIKGRVLVKVATIYEWRSSWTSSMEHLEKALEIFESYNDLGGKALALAERGRILRRIGNYDSSLGVLEEALRLVKDDPVWGDESERKRVRMLALKERASIHYYRDKCSDAINDYETVLSLAKELKDEATESSVLMNIGLSYVHTGKTEKGIDYYERSIEQSKRVGNLRTLAFTYANLAETLAFEKRFDEAMGYLRKALETFYRIEDRLSIAHTHMIFGLLLTEKKELEEAVVHFNMALEMALEIKETAILAQIFGHFGKLYALKGDPAMARKLYKKAIALHEESGRMERGQKVRKLLEELEKSRAGRLGGASVGRKDEIIKLIGAFRKVTVSDGQVVVLNGTSGTGKSKVVDQFLKITRPNKPFTLIARCTPRESAMPYAPFLEALESVFQKEIPTETLTAIREVVADNPHEMLKLFPMLGAVPEIAKLAARSRTGGSQLSSIQKDKDRLFENITRLLLAFTITRPVILVLDDFHWADTSSIGLAHYLARKSADSQLLILITYSPDVLTLDWKSHPLTDTLRLMNRERLTTNLDLKNLNEKETWEMVRLLLDGIKLPDEVYSLVYKETEGNPFFIEEVILSLLDQGIIDPNDEEDPVKGSLSDIVVPKTMSQVVERRLSSLDDEERGLLRYAGIIGFRFDFDTLQSIANLPEDKLVNHLDKLMVKGMIIEEETEDSFRFPLEHFRRVVTEGLPTSETIKLHDKVARILERRPRPEEHAFDLAHHHRLAGNLLKAAEWSYVAGEQARRLAASEEAATQLRTALDLLTQLPRSKDVQNLKAKVQNAYGDVSYKSGNYEEAAQHFLYMLETAKDIGDEGLLAKAYLGIGRVRSGRGAFPQAKESFLKALEVFEKLGDLENIIQARRAVSVILWREGVFEEAVGEILQCMEVNKKLKDDGLQASLNAGLGNVYRDMGEWQKSISHFQRAISQLEKGGDRYELGTAYNNIGATYRYMREWDLAIEYFKKCIVVCRKIKFPNILGYGLKNMGEVLAKRGRAEDLDDADDHCDEAMTIFEDLHHKPGIANVYMNKGIIQRFRKRHDDAKAQFEKAIKVGRASGVPDLVADIYYEYALTLRDVKSLDEAKARMKKALEIYEKVGASGRIERAKQFLDDPSQGMGGDGP